MDCGAVSAYTTLIGIARREIERARAFCAAQKAIASRNVIEFTANNVVFRGKAIFSVTACVCGRAATHTRVLSICAILTARKPTRALSKHAPALRLTESHVSISVGPSFRSRVRRWELQSVALAATASRAKVLRLRPWYLPMLLRQ